LAAIVSTVAPAAALDDAVELAAVLVVAAAADDDAVDDAAAAELVLVLVLDELLEPHAASDSASATAPSNGRRGFGIGGSPLMTGVRESRAAPRAAPADTQDDACGAAILPTRRRAIVPGGSGPRTSKEPRR
jgi:hypothetical protein